MPSDEEWAAMLALQDEEDAKAALFPDDPSAQTMGGLGGGTTAQPPAERVDTPDALFDQLTQAAPDVRARLGRTLATQAEPMPFHLREKAMLHPVRMRGDDPYRGRRTTIEAEYGNAYETPDGNIFARDPKTGKVHVLEPTPTGVAGAITEAAMDVLDIRPELVEAGASALTSAVARPALMAAGAPLGPVGMGVGAAVAGGAGAGAASMARSGVSELTGGSSYEEEGVDKVIEMGREAAAVAALDAIAGGASEAAAGAVKWVGSKLPRGRAEAVLKDLLGEEGAKDAIEKQLARQQAGAPSQSLAEMTGGREAARVTSTARAVDPESFRSVEVKNLVKRARKTDEVFRMVSETPMTSEEAVGRIGVAMAADIKNLEDAVSETAEEMYRGLEKTAGTRRMMTTENARAELKKIIQESPPIGDEVLQWVGRRLDGKRVKVEGFYKQAGLTVKEFKELRTLIGQSTGSGGWELHSKGSVIKNKAIAKRLYSALEKDLLSMAEGAGQSRQGDAARALIDSGAEYRRLKGLIREKRQTALAKGLEKVAKDRGLDDLTDLAADLEFGANYTKLAKSLVGSSADDKQIAELMSVAQKLSPEGAQDLRGAVIRETLYPVMIETGTEESQAALKTGLDFPLDYKKLSSLMLHPKNQAKAARLRAAAGPQAYNALEDMARRADEVLAAAKREGKELSQSDLFAAMLTPGGVGRAASVGGRGAGAAGAAGAGVLRSVWLRLKTPRALSQALADPESSAIIRTLMNPSKQTSWRPVIAALNRLMVKLPAPDEEDIEDVAKATPIGGTLYHGSDVASAVYQKLTEERSQ